MGSVRWLLDCRAVGRSERAAAAAAKAMFGALLLVVLPCDSGRSSSLGEKIWINACMPAAF